MKEVLQLEKILLLDTIKTIAHPPTKNMRLDAYPLVKESDMFIYSSNGYTLKNVLKCIQAVITFINTTKCYTCKYPMIVSII